MQPEASREVSSLLDEAIILSNMVLIMAKLLWECFSNCRNGHSICQLLPGHSMGT